jgi:NADPH2:quinone reductase
MVRSLSVSGGSLQNYLLTRDELMGRANDAIEGMRVGWLKLRIFRVLPLAEASEAHSLLENRQTIGKLLLSTGTATP